LKKGNARALIGFWENPFDKSSDFEMRGDHVIRGSQDHRSFDVIETPQAPISVAGLHHRIYLPAAQDRCSR
jgi:hypothetical protein